MRKSGRKQNDRYRALKREKLTLRWIRGAAVPDPSLPFAGYSDIPKAGRIL
jgi:hypothetical protein